MANELSDVPTRPQIDLEQVQGILRQVVDPEVGKNIVAMGLVYRIDVTTDHLLIEMTMTSPACPMGEMILDHVEPSPCISPPLL